MVRHQYRRKGKLHGDADPISGRHLHDGGALVRCAVFVVFVVFVVYA